MIARIEPIEHLIHGGIIHLPEGLNIYQITTQNPFAQEPWRVNVADFGIQVRDPTPFLEVMPPWETNWWEWGGKEETLAASDFGKPSLLVRIDGVGGVAGEPLHVYEIDQRPAGQGLAAKVIPQFREWLRGLGWAAVVVIDQRTKGGDDSLWAYKVVYDEEHFWEICRKEGAWIAPRGFKEVEEGKLPYPPLSPKCVGLSIWPVKFSNWKGYGKGWLFPFWREGDNLFDDLEEWLNTLCNNAANKYEWPGMVVKTDAHRLRGVWVIIFSSFMKIAIKWRVLGGTGTTSLKACLRELRAQASLAAVYVQPFFPPHPVVIGSERMWGIWRIFVGYDLHRKRWTTAGGFLNIRPSIGAIHGATDSVLVPVVFGT